MKSCSEGYTNISGLLNSDLANNPGAFRRWQRRMLSHRRPGTSNGSSGGSSRNKRYNKGSRNRNSSWSNNRTSHPFFAGCSVCGAKFCSRPHPRHCFFFRVFTLFDRAIRASGTRRFPRALVSSTASSSTPPFQMATPPEPDSFGASTVLRCGNEATEPARIPDSSDRLFSGLADATLV